MFIAKGQNVDYMTSDKVHLIIDLHIAMSVTRNCIIINFSLLSNILSIDGTVGATFESYTAALHVECRFDSNLRKKNCIAYITASVSELKRENAPTILTLITD